VAHIVVIHRTSPLISESLFSSAVWYAGVVLLYLSLHILLCFITTPSKLLSRGEGRRLPQADRQLSRIWFRFRFYICKSVYIVA